MADQIEIQLPKTVINEENAFVATAYFRTRSSKAASIPTTIHYKVDCLTTKTPLIDWTSVSAAANVDLIMTSAVNTIQSADSHFETKQLLVKSDSGLSTQAIGRTTWKVQNLHGIG